MTRWLTEEALEAHKRLYGKQPGRIVRLLDKAPPKADLKAPKYHAKPTEVDGIKFDSKKEAKRYKDLLLLQKAGKITDLKLQPVIRCVVNGELVCKYIADFFYIDRETFKEVYLDVKGYRTPIYRLKKKLVFACLGISITEG